MKRKWGCVEKDGFSREGYRIRFTTFRDETWKDAVEIAEAYLEAELQKLFMVLKKRQDALVAADKE